MIKIFLAEDEFVIRNGIKNSIDWNKEGYEFVGDAGDGELAYPLIMKEKPDILITDIRMPFMDGLELSRMVKRELPDIKIIILSGYNEFEYAKEAIQIGATDYLLKPISSSKLLEALSGVSKEIRKEREEKLLKQRYQLEMQENIEKEKFVLFNRMITGQAAVSEILETGKRLGVNFGAQAYNILLFKAAMNITKYSSQEEAQTVFEILDHIADEFEGIFEFWRGAEGWAFLITGEDEEDVRTKLSALKYRMHEVMEAYPKVEYFGGSGHTVLRLRNLAESYHTAAVVFSNRFICDARQILSLEELQSIQEKGKINVQHLDIVERNRRLMEKFLSNGTIEEIAEFVDAYFEEIPKENLQSELMRQYITMDIFITVSSFCDRVSTEYNMKERETKELEHALKNIVSAEGVKHYLSQLLIRVLEQRDSTSGKRYSDIIQNARQFIMDNYMSDAISLNTVSANVNMSPSYFSTVFSREMGKTFVEYLTEIRMDKAKELLMCSAMKTSEIGFEVGYKDPHYFSYIFKKTQKCSPKEYRQRGK